MADSTIPIEVSDTPTLHLASATYTHGGETAHAEHSVPVDESGALIDFASQTTLAAALVELQSAVASLAGTLTVGGTVAVTGTQTDGLTDAELRASDVGVATQEHGATPGYGSGTAGGTVSVPSGARLLAVSALAEGGDGTFTVDAGDAVTVRDGKSVDWNQRGNWLGPLDVVFTSTLDYLVEWVTP